MLYINRFFQSFMGFFSMILKEQNFSEVQIYPLKIQVFLFNVLKSLTQMYGHVLYLTIVYLTITN